MSSKSEQNDPNDTGSGKHNPRYDQHYLDQHVEAQNIQRKVKPLSPYDDTEVNVEWLTNFEPDLPGNYITQNPPYTPLLRPHWIRVLRLEPGYTYTALRCTLEHINLDDSDHIPYEAISYTWGSYYDNPLYDRNVQYRQSDDVVCHGVWVHVTQSLAQALHKLRLRDRARILWADALCINQQDPDEKSWQVGMMSLIYKEARDVMIWIGYRDPVVVEQTMDLIRDLVNQECSSEQRYGRDAEWHEDSAIIVSRQPDPLAPESPSSVYSADLPPIVPSKPKLEASSLRPLADLFEARYFSRLWVFQEVALSPMATMSWSQARIRFEWVALVADLIATQYMAEFACYDEAIDGLQNCAKMYKTWKGAYASNSFFDLLVTTKDFKSGVPVDKVFGLLGIKTRETDPNKGMLFLKKEEVNYKIGKDEVFRIVAKRVLVDQQDVRCLAAVEHRGGIDEGRPSWVPDFASLGAVFLPDLHTSAHLDTKACITCSEECPVKDCMRFKGILVDTVTSVINPGFQPTSHWRSTDTHVGLQRLIHILRPRYSNEDIALCLTAGFKIDMISKVTDLTTHVSAMLSFSAWHTDISITNQEKHIISPPPESSNEETRTAYKFFQASAKAMHNRCVLQTEGGLLGVGQLCVEQGDLVVVLFGGHVPFVLRKYEVEGSGRDHYRLVGQSYVCGLMEGQGIKRWKESQETAMELHLL